MVVDSGNQCRYSGWLDRFPYHAARVGRSGQAIVIAILYQLIVGLIERDLLLDRGFFRLTQLAWVQLVTKCSKHGDAGSGGKRGGPSRLMVGNGGDMRTDTGNGKPKRSAILDMEAFDGVGGVAAPNLRGVIQHPSVKASAAATAALKKTCKTCQHIVQA